MMAMVTMIVIMMMMMQVNLNELDQQMEAIKEMFVKKQEMMKKMSVVEVHAVRKVLANFAVLYETVDAITKLYVT